MALATLADLQSAVADFGTGRTDLSTDTINNFITLAENDIEHGTYGEGGMVVSPPLRVRAMEVRTTLTLTGEYTTLPADYLEMREVTLTSATWRPPLEFKVPEAFDNVYSAASSGPARSYSIVANTIRVGPGAASGDVINITYYQSLPGLVANSTNWLMTGWPNVYLYGSLRHLAPYIGAMDFLPVWQAAYLSSVWSCIKSQDKGSYTGISMRPVSVGVTIT